jgi:ATP-dependent protease ClpP protease subunit
MSQDRQVKIPVVSVPPPGEAAINATVESFIDEWFHVRMVDGVAFVTISGEIGLFRPWRELVAQVAGAKDIKLFIDSVGGDTIAGVELFHALHGRVSETTITDKCFSAALPIALAGTKIRIERHARILCHAPCSWKYGHADEMILTAGWLKKNSAYLKKIIMERTELSETVVAGWLNGADFYFTAEQACAYGLADEIFDAPKLDADGVPVATRTEKSNIPTLSEDELFFNDVLLSVGRLKVRNRADFMRELCAWAAYNTDEEPKSL